MPFLVVYDMPAGIYIGSCKRDPTEAQLRTMVERLIRGRYQDAMRLDESSLTPSQVARAVIECASERNVKFWEVRDWNFFDFDEMQNFRGRTLSDIEDAVKKDKGWTNF